MKLRQTIILTVLGVMAVLAWQAYERYFPPENTIKLTFKAEAAGKPLVFNQFAYSNPGGPGTFRIRDFRFYLSGIRLDPGQGGQVYEVPDSYHLVRFDNADQSYVLELDKIPLRQVENVTFAIGVDAQANTSIEVKGDLDPNSQMAWNWEVGYKFVLLEGGIKVDEQIAPLVYHVGFGENRREQSFDLRPRLELGNATDLSFTVDMMKLFDGSTTVDMATLNSVKFDKRDASMLADNYSQMIELNRF